MDNFNYKKYLAEGRLLKETKEEDYYNLLMDLGGTELAGDTFEDMMYKRGEYVSFEDFLDDELDFFQKEGDVEVIDKIKSTFLNEGRLYENASLEVNVNEEEDYVEVTYNGESYKSALGDELLFIHNFEDDEYHSENDAPEIFKYLKGIGGELLVDDEEATLTIKMSDLD